jgi:hypothetical protein
LRRQRGAQTSERIGRDRPARAFVGHADYESFFHGCVFAISDRTNMPNNKWK